VAFVMVGALAASAVFGLDRRWRGAVLLGCVLLPIAKDCAQIGMATRHYNTPATLLGVAGALVGFGLGHVAAKYLTSWRLGASGDPAE